MQNNETICCIICVGAQLTLGGQDIFARKCMYEKIIKRAAKTGFEIQSYIPRTYEMKNRILSKNKGCLFILLPKSTARILNDVCPKNTFSPELGGGVSAPCLLSPTPMSCMNAFRWRLPRGSLRWLLQPLLTIKLLPVIVCIFVSGQHSQENVYHITLWVPPDSSSCNGRSDARRLKFNNHFIMLHIR